MNDNAQDQIGRRTGSTSPQPSPRSGEGVKLDAPSRPSTRVGEGIKSDISRRIYARRNAKAAAAGVMEEILPCAFCGGLLVAVMRPANNLVYLACDSDEEGCGALGPSAPDRARAIERWNHRPTIIGQVFAEVTLDETEDASTAKL